MRPLVLSRFWYMATISALDFPRNFSGTSSLSATAGDGVEVGVVVWAGSGAVTASRSAESAVSELPGASRSETTRSAKLVTFNSVIPADATGTAAGYGAGWKSQDRERSAEKRGLIRC